jgi:hypothetical protein
MSSIKHRSTKRTPATPAPKSIPASDSVVFAAEWSDGTKTRMSIYTAIEELDVKRAVAVSRAAYSSRKRMPVADIAARIERAHFEKDGVVVRSFTIEELPS